MKLGSKMIFSAGFFFAGAALIGYLEKNKEDSILVRGRIDKLFYEDGHLSEIEVLGVKYEDTTMEKAIIRIGESTSIIKKFTKDNITSKELKQDDIVEIVVERNENSPTITNPKKIILMT